MSLLWTYAQVSKVMSNAVSILFVQVESWKQKAIECNSQLIYNTALPLADSAVDQCIRNKHQVSCIQTKQVTNYLLWLAIFFVD